MAKKYTSKIGGQAVIEGVMMRGERSMATAVRDEKGNIVVESRYIKPVSERPKSHRIPFVRGVFNFFDSMAMGVKTLMRSGEVFEGDVEPGKSGKWFAKNSNKYLRYNDGIFRHFGRSAGYRTVFLFTPFDNHSDKRRSREKFRRRRK